MIGGHNLCLVISAPKQISSKHFSTVLRRTAVQRDHKARIRAESIPQSGLVSNDGLAVRQPLLADTVLARPAAVQLRQIIVAAGQRHTRTGKRKQLHIAFFAGVRYLGPGGKDFRSLVIPEILSHHKRIYTVFENKLQQFSLVIRTTLHTLHRKIRTETAVRHLDSQCLLARRGNSELRHRMARII